jgi:alanyl-tRNA synthetase
MTTERLYYDDSYQLAFGAEVVEQTTAKGKPALVLDRTCFYPEGGGQPADHGSLNGVPVLDVQSREADRAVLHILGAPLGDSRVEGQIDRTRRLDHMQHHSGQHVLSQALERAARAETLSVHMSAESMTIDIDRADLTPYEWVAVEELANQIVLDDRPVRAWFPAPDELAALPIRKLPDVAGGVRIVDMGGFDITACGGTLRDYRDKHDVISRLMSTLTVGHRELNDTVARLQTDNRTLRAELKAAREQLAEAEALALLSVPARDGGRRIVARAFEGRSADEVRLLAQKIVAHPDTVALLGAAGEKAQLIFGRSADLSIDVVPALKAALKALGVERGGGRPDFAQGGGVAASLSQIQAALQVAEAMLEG